MNKRFGAVALIGVAAVTLAGCASGGGTGGDSGKVDGKGRTLTVWAMAGDLSVDTLTAINAEFTKETGGKVKVETQQWKDIATKITTALASNTPPDVLDLGNTQVATFAASGGLADLTKYKDELAQGQTWLGGLADPAMVDGKLYAVPSFAGARAVVYNKQLWSAAGITAAPTTYDELKADLDKLKAANPAPDFSAFYLPGMNWYGAMQWVWDAGGDIATQSGGKWKAGFASDSAQKGLTEWKSFQNTYSIPASQTLNTDKPDQDQVFADGKAGAIIANGWEIGVIQKDNPKLTNDVIGSFPLPGASGKNQPVMLGGSDWGIAAKSKNQDLARVWTKIAASPDIQKKWVFGKDGWIPNSVEGSKAAVDGGTLTDLQKAFFTSAQNSKATPASGNWASLEDPGMTQFFASIASGAKSPSDAATAWDSTVESTLNQ